MDSPQLIGDINMLVQMIEIEEVQIMQVSDEVLEKIVVGAVGAFCSDGTGHPTQFWN